MAAGAPPAYAWDWLARQRLVWREARSRLAASPDPVGARYAAVQDRGEVLTRLRADYLVSPEVRDSLHGAIAEVAFLGRTGLPFAQVGFRAAPRGLRWWWSAITGEVLERPPRSPTAAELSAQPQQLTLPELAELDPQPALDDVAEGYGDRPH
ncbi:MAG: hypothetical protein ACLFS9_11570 [Nitriliruptoraceae bacterium]